jgi:hypothetical protein
LGDGGCGQGDARQTKQQFPELHLYFSPDR